MHGCFASHATILRVGLYRQGSTRHLFALVLCFSCQRGIARCPRSRLGRRTRNCARAGMPPSGGDFQGRLPKFNDSNTPVPRGRRASVNEFKIIPQVDRVYIYIYISFVRTVVSAPSCPPRRRRRRRPFCPNETKERHSTPPPRSHFLGLKQKLLDGVGRCQTYQ